MAGTATHYIFGLEAYGRLADVVGIDSLAREAFLLGNFGPDPFLFLKAIPAARKYHKVGTYMHQRLPSELLSAVHGRFVTVDDATSATRAYALGFLCHYLLDSAVHPLVVGQQVAICAYGIEGLRGRRARRAAHATIETEVDELMMTAKLGATAAEIVPHRSMFRCSAQLLGDVSRRIADVFDEVYGIRIPLRLFSQAYYVNKACQAAFDSKCAGLRRHVDYVALLGRLSPYVQSMTYSGAPRYATPLANDDHVPWPHPHHDGLIVADSFGELYASAFTRALEVLPDYGGQAFGLDECAALTDGINFSGKRVSA